MTRRLRSEKCDRCGLPPPLCLCAALQPFPCAIRVLVVIHHREAVRPSNTGHLLPLLLSDAQHRLRGEPPPFEAPFAPPPLDLGIGPAVVLYPADDALELTADAPLRTLVVPDGNWAQARRTVQREPGLPGLPRVRLPAGPPPLRRLRGHPEDDHLSTLEAVARALGILAGPPVQAHLEAAWQRFADAVERLREGGI